MLVRSDMWSWTWGDGVPGGVKPSVSFTKTPPPPPQPQLHRTRAAPHSRADLSYASGAKLFSFTQVARLLETAAASLGAATAYRVRQLPL